LGIFEINLIVYLIFLSLILSLVILCVLLTWFDNCDNLYFNENDFYLVPDKLLIFSNYNKAVSIEDRLFG